MKQIDTLILTYSDKKNTQLFYKYDFSYFEYKYFQRIRRSNSLCLIKIINILFYSQDGSYPKRIKIHKSETIRRALEKSCTLQMME